MGSFWLWGWWFFLTLPDRLSCPLFIYMVHFEFEFTVPKLIRITLRHRHTGCNIFESYRRRHYCGSLPFQKEIKWDSVKPSKSRNEFIFIRINSESVWLMKSFICGKDFSILSLIFSFLFLWRRGTKTPAMVNA